jgi:hypothetical protein
MLSFFCTPLYGHWSDRAGRRPFILLSLLATALPFVALATELPIPVYLILRYALNSCLFYLICEDLVFQQRFFQTWCERINFDLTVECFFLNSSVVSRKHVWLKISASSCHIWPIARCQRSVVALLAI